jgi:hypothetical protein
MDKQLRNVSIPLVVSNINEGDKVSIYPNPVNEVLNVKITSGKINSFSIRISDLTGRVVFAMKNVPPSHS